MLPESDLQEDIPVIEDIRCPGFKMVVGLEESSRFDCDHPNPADGEPAAQ
jgi:hypothetical protein